jgi:hypothetical protein
VIVEQRAAVEQPLLDAFALPTIRARKLETVSCPALESMEPWLLLMDADGR